MTTTIGFTDTDKSTSAVLEDVIRSMDAEHITLRQILEKMGESGLLLLCGLLSLPFLVPVSIPGVSTVFGAGIVLIGIAVTFNRFPWLPSKLADRKLERSKLVPVLGRGLTILRKVDRYVRPRLLGLTTGGLVSRINGLVLTFAGVLLMMPLSFIPFSNTVPGIALLFLAVGLIQRDGAAVLLGHLANVASIVYFGVLIGGGGMMIQNMLQN